MSSSVRNQRFQLGSYGPGPAAYTLPPVIGYKFEGNRKIDRYIPNMFSFGHRRSMRFTSIGPGPASGTPSKFGENQDAMTRFGKPASYKYTFGKRIPMRSGFTRTPGPADTYPDQSKMTKEEWKRIERNLHGKGPEFTFGIRPRRVSKQFGPGPNAYVTNDKLDLYKPRAPRYTMNSRLYRRNVSQSPGAAAYHPYVIEMGQGKFMDRVDPIRPRSGAYTILSRPRGYIRTFGPGPDTYDIRPYKGIKGKNHMGPSAVDGTRGPTWVFGRRCRNAPMIIQEDII